MRNILVGGDFYSTNAYSYIFANPRISSMTVDVSVDLQQIIGRQRLEENPFRNSATLYFNTRESRVDRQALEEAVREKKEKTQRQIKNYTVAPYKNEMLQMMETRSGSMGIRSTTAALSEIVMAEYVSSKMKFWR